MEAVDVLLMLSGLHTATANRTIYGMKKKKNSLVK